MSVFYEWSFYTGFTVLNLVSVSSEAHTRLHMLSLQEVVMPHGAPYIR